MKYIKQVPKTPFGYETTEISKEEALKYVDEETLIHLYKDLVRGAGAFSALEQIGSENLFIGVQV